MEEIGRSIQGRPLQLLTITNPKNLEFDQDDEMPETKSELDSDSDIRSDSVTPSPRMKTPVVFIMARAHSAETPSSFICQGFIDFLLSGHEIAKVLRSYIVFKIVPVINPDGAFLGKYERKSIRARYNKKCWTIQ